MKRLGYYLSIQVLYSVFFSLFALLSLFVFFDFIAELARMSKGDYHFKNVILHIIFLIPEHIYRLLPTAVLIGGTFSLSALTYRSELIVMQASGISLIQILKWLFLCGLLFAIFVAVIGEFLGPMSLRIARQHISKVTHSVLFGDFRSGIWVKDGDQIVNFKKIMPDFSLQQVHIYKFSQDQVLKEMIDAKMGHYNENQWILEQVVKTYFESNLITLSHFPNLLWKTSINPDTLSILMAKPEEMSISSLNNYIAYLKKNGGDIHRYEFAIWTKIIYPFSCIGMLFVSLLFSLGQSRNIKVGLRVFFGILLGLIFNFSSQILGYIGIVYHLPAWFFAGMPTFVLFLTTLWIVWYKEGLRHILPLRQIGEGIIK